MIYIVHHHRIHSSCSTPPRTSQQCKDHYKMVLHSIILRHYECTIMLPSGRLYTLPLLCVYGCAWLEIHVRDWPSTTSPAIIRSIWFTNTISVPSLRAVLPLMEPNWYGCAWLEIHVRDWPSTIINRFVLSKRARKHSHTTSNYSYSLYFVLMWGLTFTMYTAVSDIANVHMAEYKHFCNAFCVKYIQVLLFRHTMVYIVHHHRNHSHCSTSPWTSQQSEDHCKMVRHSIFLRGYYECAIMLPSALTVQCMGVHG